MKQICANCQFFIRQYRGHGGAEHTFEIGAAQRAQAERGDLSWQRDSESIACFKGVWDEGLGMGGPAKIVAISQQERRGNCYYFQFQPGMLLPAADKLQQERAAASTEWLKYRLAIYALLLTVIALIAKIAYGA